ncbi:MAG: inositol monophosphatase family protein [Desulfobaccales bacterium]|nr:inositol monophosphatase family protein [Desulfobaccales bacterium]
MAQIGRQAALAAGEVLRRDYLKPHHITLKGAIDPVTETDLKSQETIINLIRQHFPDHGILAEEVLGEGPGTGGPCPPPKPPSQPFRGAGEAGARGSGFSGPLKPLRDWGRGCGGVFCKGKGLRPLAPSPKFPLFKTQRLGSYRGRPRP